MVGPCDPCPCCGRGSGKRRGALFEGSQSLAPPLSAVFATPPADNLARFSTGPPKSFSGAVFQGFQSLVPPLSAVSATPPPDKIAGFSTGPLKSCLTAAGGGFSKPRRIKKVRFALDDPSVPSAAGGFSTPPPNKKVRVTEAEQAKETVAYVGDPEQEQKKSASQAADKQEPEEKVSLEKAGGKRPTGKLRMTIAVKNAQGMKFNMQFHCRCGVGQDVAIA